jgi:hypothetical protein
VQGQLRNEAITFTILTQCVHCGREIRIEMDRDLNFILADPQAKPLVFVPMVDFKTLKDPSIIDAF